MPPRPPHVCYLQQASGICMSICTTRVPPAKSRLALARVQHTKLKCSQMTRAHSPGGPRGPVLTFSTILLSGRDKARLKLVGGNVSHVQTLPESVIHELQASGFTDDPKDSLQRGWARMVQNGSIAVADWKAHGGVRVPMPCNLPECQFTSRWEIPTFVHAAWYARAGARL